MKKSLLLLCFLILSFSAYGQEEERKNNLLLEVGGSSVPYTVGYERVLKNSASNELRVKFGLGLIKTLECSYCSTDDAIGRSREIEEIVSLELLNLWGKGRGRLEYGIGFGMTNAYNFSNTYLLSGRIGYRFISLNNGFNFGVGLNPSWKISGYEIWTDFIPMPGLKIGYGF
ncbi:hypothetical protein [Nafulsella turpanensis]|uniref:hypothetical protein n=1 Tax=Nafulsella turpanensis TaxID=1265690 RepID=UPI00034863AA|nr:hypothetical protein [Nafulsella turpanensis]